MTRVVNIHHGSPYDVYIGRPGKGHRGPFGNPILIGGKCQVCLRKHGREPGLIRCYEAWLAGRLACDPVWREKVRSLAGKTLGCFCVRADGTGLCHGIPLSRAADLLHAGKKVTADELRAPEIGPSAPHHLDLPLSPRAPFAVSAPDDDDNARVLIVATETGRHRARFERGPDGRLRCVDAAGELAWMLDATAPVREHLRATGTPHWWIAAPSFSG